MAQVSILTPTVGRPTLQRTIQSVLAQGFWDWEMLIVPNSVRWPWPSCDIPDDPRIRVLPDLGSCRDSGTRARQVALREATGKYLCTLDDDDWWESRFLGAMVKAMARSDVAYCHTILHDRMTNEPRCLWGEPFNAAKLRQANYLLSPSLMFRRELWQDYQPQGGYNSDWDILLHCLDQGARFQRIGLAQAHLSADDGVWNVWPGQAKPLAPEQGLPRVSRIQPGQGMINHAAVQIAEGILGWMEHEELLWHSDVAAQCDAFLEIGAFHGRSTKAIAMSCPGVVYVVDPWVNYLGHHGEHTYLDFLDQLAPELASGKVRVLRKTSAQALTDLAGIRFDTIFLDGDHEYPTISADLQRYGPLVREGGLLAGHDYGFPQWPGVERAVRGQFGEVERGPNLIWWTNL